MSELILNPKSNRYIKKDSQIGKRLLKELRAKQPEAKPAADINPPEIIKPAEPKTLKEPKILKIQKAVINTGVDIVAKNPDKFKNLSEREVDKLFKKLLLERLGVSNKSPKQKPIKSKPSKKFKVVQPSSSSESDSD